MSEQATRQLQDKRILIVGLGKTGLSCVRFLSALNVDLAVTDSRVEPPYLDTLNKEFSDIAVFVGGFDEMAFRRADIILVSPGISLREPLIAEARARGAEIIGDIELFAWFVDMPVIAITGSNGKSTVTTLVGQMLNKAGMRAGVGGNIGTPALELLQQDNQICVLELSSFQLETTESLNATAAALLNISEDHMDRYDSLADYASAKAKVFYGSGVLVVNADDENVMAMAQQVSRGRRLVSFSLAQPSPDGYGVCLKDGQRWLCRGEQLLLPASELKVTGNHNIANVLAALALGEAVGLPMPVMLEATREFTGLPHRCQWVLSRDGVTWINDSKATNVGAAIAAIQGVPGEKLVLIMGGQGKGQDFSSLQPVIAERARAVILLGEDAGLIEKQITDVTPVEHADSMQQAVSKAKQAAQAGDTVLFSPACASFDMFNGFEHRGEMFIDSIRSLYQ